MAIKFLSDVVGSGELEGNTLDVVGAATFQGVGDTALVLSSGDVIVGGSHGNSGQVLTSNGENNSLSWTDKTTNTNNYVTSATFNSQNNGVLTLNQTGVSSVTVDLDGRYLQLGGGTMTGNIVITTLTTTSASSAIGSVSNPIANIYATNVSANLKGTIASTVTGSTQSQDDNSTKIATTAYVDTAVSEIPAGSDTTYDLTTLPSGTGLRLDPSTGSNDDITFTGTGGLTITRNSSTQLTFNAPAASSTPTLAQVTTAGSTTTNAITVGTITNNGSITTSTTANVGTNLTVLGNSSLVSLDVGGGFGSTGATISATGNVSANGDFELGGTMSGNFVVRSTNNANTDGANFAVDTTNKSTLEYAYEVLRSGTTVGGILLDGKVEGTEIEGTSLDINGNADISGDLTGVDTLTATTFSGDLNGTINTATTAATQSQGNSSTKVATTAYVDTAVANIPSGLSFEGSWNASTDSPSLAGTAPANGVFYIVSVAGNTNLDGITDWVVGDWAVYVSDGAGTDAWQKIDNTSTLGGAGTAGVIPKWSAATTLADSTISDDGTDVTMSGDLTVSGGEFTLGSSATTSIGKNLLKVPNISAVRFIRLNANESVDTLSATDFRTAIGAGTSSTTGTVTGVTGTSPINSDGSSSSPDISIDTADANTTGALTSTDWNTFNSKTSNTGTVTASNGSANEIAVFSSATNIDGDANLKYGTVANQLQLVDGTSTLRIGSNSPGYLDIGNNSIIHSDGSPSTTFSISSDRGIKVTAPANKSSAYALFTPTDIETYKLDTTTNSIKHFFSQDVDFSATGTVDLNGPTNAVTQTAGDNSTKVATTAFVFSNAITGSGVSGRIPYYDGTKSITSESPLAYNDTDNRLELVGQVDFRNAVTQVTGTILEEAPQQNMVSGEIVFLGSAGSSQAGRAYILQSNNTWIGVTDNVEARASGMVALAIGTNFNEGMLLRGFAKFQGGSSSYANYGSLDTAGGAKIYVGSSSTHSGAGNMTTTLNTTSGQFVRILGYSTGTGNSIIYFNPDKSYIENA